MTQTFIARKLGRTPQWLSNIEAGRRGIEAGELYTIAQILGISVEAFHSDRFNDALRTANSRRS